MVYPLKTLLAGLAACSLVACGGGGGGDSTPAPPANIAPIATFSVSVSDGPAPLDVDFDASASRDPDGSITSYDWDFGDGTAAASGVTTSHRYNLPGTFTVTLRVTDNEGFSVPRSTGIRARGATISGNVQILSSSARDSDVNDRLTQVVSNNDFNSAQRLGNPVLLGGYVNLPGTGPRDDNGDYITTGNLFASGDSADVYAISLTGNEQILLTIAEADADLDLYLYDAQQNYVDASVGLQATESLQVDTPGDYFIEVVPFNGPTNPAGASTYVLSVGQNLTITTRGVGRVSDPFVAGELLLTSNRETAVAEDWALETRGRAGAMTLSAIAGDWPSQARKPDTARASLSAEIALRSARGMSPEQSLKYRTLLALKQLSRDPRITLAEANLIRLPQLTPNDPFYSLQWHYPAISLPAAWDITTGAAAPGDDPVIVAVVDTGVLLNHPDLRNQLVAGFDFIRDPARARDGNGIDSDPSDEGDLAFASASSFHGSHVAGTIAAQSNNGTGVAGVSWNARLMPLRALGVDGGTNYDVIQAVRYAAGLSNDSGTTPARRADIINLSLGSEFRSDQEQTVFNQVRQLGIIVVASAGNASSSLPSYPAGYDGVIAVSATDINSNIAPYSNFGSSIDVAAPGGFNITDQNGDGIGDGVVSTLGDDSGGSVQFGYAALNGTSMAAPHVAGVAALMKALHPALTPAEFDMALLSGDLTDDLGAPGRDNNFGNGLINAQKSVLTALALAAGSGSDPGPILGASTSALNFGILTTQQALEVRNLGTGDLQLGQIVSTQPWLSAIPLSVDAGSGLGSYNLVVDRNGLSDGTYSASLAFVPGDPAINSVTISVVMQVSLLNIEADAGLVYVLLVDAAGDSVGAPDIVSVDAGVYPFTLQDVPAGEYRLFAGTDIDDDSFLCDAGEACGAFRTLDAPEVLIVEDASTELTGLSFVTEFRAIITSPTAATTAVTPGAYPGFVLRKDNSDSNGASNE